MPRRSPYPYAPSILVVDDDSQVQRLCVKTLAEAGYFVTGASTGRDGLAAIDTSSFEVAIVDLSLPDIDGFEFLRLARMELPELQIIMMSGFMEETLMATAMSHGAAAILSKPFELDSLFSTVCSVLSTKLFGRTNNARE